MITLEAILASRDDKYASFSIYLQNTYCIENLFFWQDVQHYKSNPTLDKYKFMIQTYIVTNSPYEINIPCQMRQKLLCNDCTPQCFDDSEDTVLELLRINSFIPWYHTIYQQNLHRQYRHSVIVSCPEHMSRPSFSSVRVPSPPANSLRNKFKLLFNKSKKTFLAC